jgi:murein DD-endopeptidase MepM/ murein hydrolase activator NlpD
VDSWIIGGRGESWQEEEERAASQKASQGRRGLITYEVARGDTLSTIAERFGISQETLVWANNIINPDFLRLGQKLLILPVSGVLHIVQRGETLSGIARRYGAKPSDILAYAPNGLTEPDKLSIGQKLIIPGGKMPRLVPSSRGGIRQQVPSSPVGGRAVQAAAIRFAWPTAGPITQYFSRGHRALDIAPPYGTPIRAAAGGRVVEARRLRYGYGWYLIIDHGQGYSTLYAHMGRFNVWTGTRVAAGQIIGAVGATGRVTGPHLHFEVRRNGVAVNPLSVLP